MKVIKIYVTSDQGILLHLFWTRIFFCIHTIVLMKRHLNTHSRSYWVRKNMQLGLEVGVFDSHQITNLWAEESHSQEAVLLSLLLDVSALSQGNGVEKTGSRYNCGMFFCCCLVQRKELQCYRALKCPIWLQRGEYPANSCWAWSQRICVVPINFLYFWKAKVILAFKLKNICFSDSLLFTALWTHLKLFICFSSFGL